MKGGETERYDCPSCACEFEVMLEPKAKGKPGEVAAIPQQIVQHCPFCAGDITAEDAT